MSNFINIFVRRRLFFKNVSRRQTLTRAEFFVYSVTRPVYCVYFPQRQFLSVCRFLSNVTVYQRRQFFVFLLLDFMEQLALKLDFLSELDLNFGGTDQDVVLCMNTDLHHIDLQVTTCCSDCFFSNLSDVYFQTAATLNRLT